MRLRQYTDWKVGYATSEECFPTEMVPAVVPGAVQLDMAKAKGYGSYTYADNYKDYTWMEDVYWTYTTTIPNGKKNPSERLFFVSKGIDYQFKVTLDGQILYEQEGMFTPFELDLTGKSGEILCIQIFPVPKRENAGINRSQADQSVKPAVSYGWDWHPRLIPLGIWEDTYFEVRPVSYIMDAEVRYGLSDSLNKAEITLLLSLENPQQNIIVWSFLDQEGNTIFEERVKSEDASHTLHHTMMNPRLWWPNGEGEAYLYTSRIRIYPNKGIFTSEELSPSDDRECRVGLRQVRLVMHEGAWELPIPHPATRNEPPITLEINGRRIFCKGTNWVNPEIFPGIITKETYLPLLTLAKEAHFNLLRSWGGGIINKEAFFELCDELGLMVWQEFPLACNNYEGSSEYLKILDQESKSIIFRTRRHACLVIWCGGNELFNSWSRMTDQSLALRLLNRNCYDLDPNTPFLMTSPLMGMAHGSYLFRYTDGREVFQVMPGCNNTAYTEFGCPGPSSAEYLRSFIPETELFPPLSGTTWETHHAFHAWNVVGNTWLQPELIEFYFGKPETLEQLVEWGQLLQSEGYKCIYEEARRQKPRCSMALNWCYNEPWPTAANNTIINWPAIPKPAYYAVKASCRSVLASARIPKFTYEAGEIFSCEIDILNDSPERVIAGYVKAYLKLGDDIVLLAEWEYLASEAGKNIKGPEITYQLPYRCCTQMTLKLKVPEKPEYESEYTLLYRNMSGM